VFKKISLGEIKTIAQFTDIHFGKKLNSVEHNQDCLDFIDWFISKLPENTSHIFFLGDWFENRNSINIHTLNFAHEACIKLNALNIPIIVLVGNHDLYKRSSRDIHSVSIFSEFNNFTIINEPMYDEQNKLALVPFMFNNEYQEMANELVKYKAEVLVGHLEFKQFAVTGYNVLLEHGPDHKLFKRLKLILSGHFHKRQIKDNVIYIGNTFPMDHGDAGDEERGMALLNYSNYKMEFINWDNCPRYVKTSISEISNDEFHPGPKARVKCLMDIPLSYTETMVLKETILEQFNIREFSIIESDLTAPAELGI
jgi:predicted MPP superfamily phosphohydrolase